TWSRRFCRMMRSDSLRRSKPLICESSCGAPGLLDQTRSEYPSSKQRAFAFENLMVYQKTVDFVDAVCCQTELFLAAAAFAPTMRTSRQSSAPCTRTTASLRRRGIRWNNTRHSCQCPL